VPPVNVDDYRAVKSHLDNFIDHLKRRQDKGITPYNLRNCAYHAKFDNEKLLWRDMASTGAFAYDTSRKLTNDKAFMMQGEHLSFLCALLNSSLASWFVRRSALTTGMGLPQWKKFVVENILVVRPSDSEIEHLEVAVLKLLDMQDAGSQPEADEQSRAIDDAVFRLYELTDQEILFLSQG